MPAAIVMISEIFAWIDAALAVTLPAAGRVCAWGMLSGVLSMIVYGLTSPQERLRTLKNRTTGLQRQLADYDGDFSGAMALTRQNLLLSLQRLGWALLPSLLAGVPVILILVGMVEIYSGRHVLPFGPGWMQSWLTSFFAATTIAALGTKYALRFD